VTPEDILNYLSSELNFRKDNPLVPSSFWPINDNFTENIKIRLMPKLKTSEWSERQLELGFKDYL
jgi:hypothetical protein